MKYHSLLISGDLRHDWPNLAQIAKLACRWQDGPIARTKN